MPPIRIIKSDAFRLAAPFAILFLGFTGILVGTVLWIVEGTQKAALTSANDADIATVTNGFLDEGLPEAVEVVKQRLGSARVRRAVHPDCYMVIENEQQQKLAGNLPPIVPRLGIFGINLSEIDGRVTAAGTGPRAGFIVILGRGIEVTKGIYLFVGRDTTLLAATRDRILNAFWWVALGAIVIAVFGGLLLGTRFMRRVDAIARTCKSIIAGRLEERIPLMGREDEWDRLAGAINEMLDRISALLDNLRQVSSDVAHDLRTPLTRMRNRLETARTKSMNIAQYSAAVTTAIDDTDQLLAMFAALLRISQVEAGARLNTFSRVSLTDILENMYQLYLPVTEDYGHSLISDCQKDIYVRGDAELLTQMFSNLIENAIRHTPQHTRIRIVLRSNGRVVAASIIDNGPGIDPSEYQKVLRRFYRISSSRSTAGHGLGLALVAAIAELHHAKLLLSNANPGLEVQTAFQTDWDD
ncbi:MAG: HAMP domain-containing histidine kinase [Pseudomonadota bacterium]|nr:HAMP domain-containing histidine kinase [Pseudomonadota bacterium]